MVIKVSIIEDDEKFSNMLEQILHGMEGFSVEGVYRDGKKALKHLPFECPDIILVDLNLPKMHGIECIQAIRAKYKKVRILVITREDNPENVFKALEAGANGYVVKHYFSIPDLLDSIRDVHKGGGKLSPSVAEMVIREFHRNKGEKEKITQLLTSREREILELLTKGFTNNKIGSDLGIMPKTVGKHIQNILEKLHVHSRGEAVAKWLTI